MNEISVWSDVMAKEIDAVLSLASPQTATSVQIKKELNKKVMAILKNKIANERVFGFCHHYWSFWQLYGLSFSQKTSCSPQNSCYLIWHRKPHKQPTTTTSTKKLQASFSRNVIEWFSFFAISRHLQLFEKNGSRAYELWQLIEGEKKKKIEDKKTQNVVNRDLEIVLWKSANDAVTTLTDARAQS